MFFNIIINYTFKSYYSFNNFCDINPLSKDDNDDEDDDDDGDDNDDEDYYYCQSQPGLVNKINIQCTNVVGKLHIDHLLLQAKVIITINNY